MSGGKGAADLAARSNLGRLLQGTGLVDWARGGGVAGAWQVQVAPEAGMPMIEAEEADGFLALRVVLGSRGGMAAGELPEFIRAGLLWNGRSEGNARFGLCRGLGFCLSAEAVLTGGVEDEARLKAALDGMARGWRELQAWGAGEDNGRVTAEGENFQTGGGPGPEAWQELLGGLGLPWQARPDGVAVVRLGEGRAALETGPEGLTAEMPLADVTGWPLLSRNALGLLLLSLNGRLRWAHAGWVEREERMQAVLRTESLHPLTSREVGMALEGLQVGYSLCGREVRALESVHLAEKYLEVGIHFLSDQTH